MFRAEAGEYHPPPRSWLRLLPAWVSNRLAPRIILHKLCSTCARTTGSGSTIATGTIPVFSKGDSDIYRFRRYSRQFYPAHS